MKRKQFLGALALGVFGLARGKLPPVADPAPVAWAPYPTGTFLYLDGGTLELGIVRDSILNATNDYQVFAETWEGVGRAIEISTAHT